MMTLPTTVCLRLPLLCAALLAAYAPAQCTAPGPGAYVQSYGAGCGTPPVLSAANTPVLGTACTLTTSNLPTTTLLVVSVISFEPPPTAPSAILGPFTLAPGCWNYIASPFEYVLSIFPTGSSTLTLPIPANPAWQDRVVHAQSAILTFDGSTFAMTEVSNALCLHIGT